MFHSPNLLHKRSAGLTDRKRSSSMRNTVLFLLLCACVVIVSGFDVVRVGVFVALTCDDFSRDRQSVLNATVSAAMSQTTQRALIPGSNVSVDVDVIDACKTEQSVTSLSSALDGSSPYIAVAGPGLYRLCGVASALQRDRQVRVISTSSSSSVSS